eukprot:3936346-Rhodomonas_salina.1
MEGKWSGLGMFECCCRRGRCYFLDMANMVPYSGHSIQGCTNTGMGRDLLHSMTHALGMCSGVWTPSSSSQLGMGCTGCFLSATHGRVDMCNRSRRHFVQGMW